MTSVGSGVGQSKCELNQPALHLSNPIQTFPRERSAVQWPISAIKWGAITHGLECWNLKLIMLCNSAVWRPIKCSKLQQQHVVASKVGKCQFIFTAAAAYFTVSRGYYITTDRIGELLPKSVSHLWVRSRSPHSHIRRPSLTKGTPIYAQSRDENALWISVPHVGHIRTTALDFAHSTCMAGLQAKWQKHFQTSRPQQSLPRHSNLHIASPRSVPNRNNVWKATNVFSRAWSFTFCHVTFKVRLIHIKLQ